MYSSTRIKFESSEVKCLFLLFFVCFISFFPVFFFSFCFNCVRMMYQGYKNSTRLLWQNLTRATINYWNTNEEDIMNWIFSNYWMRLSRLWRILQIKEGVIHRGRRPRWITPSEICRILHILRKPNSIIALLFIQNISSFLKEFRHYALCFSAHQI